ncbi:TonB-dependent receptor [uncultured Phocaeicola sp.]|uniref:TonB-dependent receptor n=1 Tax=uncultured Phocaeicola sp. TaxID=990718 RepID=UPI001434FF9A|nr:TonB-dependent receptor [uncultured Phocaeicola sp.]GFH97726.1 vitamin B12 transporter BtuB [Bacteroidaceae bacterium]
MNRLSFKQCISCATLCTAFLSLGASAQVVDTTRIYRIGEVVVTGSNHATGRNLLPYTVSTVKSSQLEATGQSQLLSAISGQVPGLFVSERNVLGFGVSNGGSGGIKIRGVGGSPTNAVLMMVDGQPQFAGIYSHHVADFYETEYVDRVEVLRGPGSVLYGSNAMGGVINVITKNADRNGVHTTLTSQYGSYNTWRSSLVNTVRLGNFSSLISLGYDRTDGLEDNFDFKQGSLYAKLGYDFSQLWKLRVDYSLMNFVGNDPVYPKLSNPESTDIYHQNITRGEASLSLSNYYERTNGCVRIYYSYGNHYIDDPKHFHSLDDRFGVLAYQNVRPWKDASVTLGFDYDTYTGKIPVSGGNAHTEGSISTISRKSITEYSPYITFSQDLFGGALILNTGLRMANSDRFGTQWIPQGGFVIHPAEGWTVKASWAEGYRNPSFREMYLYRSANPELDPERMMNYEVTVGKTFSRYFSMDVTGYYSKGDNLIQTVDMKNENAGRFINKGIEVSASSRPIDKLNLRASYSYLHTSLDNLTAAPRNQYFWGLGWQVLPKLKMDAELKGIGGLYVSNQTEHQKYVLLNMKITYMAFRALELFVTLNNITNIGYMINRGYTMPGFNGMGGLKVHF